MAKLYDEQFANVADYDCFSQSLFESVDGLVAMKDDPLYEEFIKMDHENFADTKNTKYVSPCILSCLLGPYLALPLPCYEKSDCTKRDRCHTLCCCSVHFALTFEQ